MSEDPFALTSFSTDQFLLNPQSQNAYSYALNNPINYVDSTGLLSMKELWDYTYGGAKAAVSSIASGAQSYATTVKTEVTIGWSLLKPAAQATARYVSNSFKSDFNERNSPEYQKKSREAYKQGLIYAGTYDGHDIYFGVGPAGIESAESNAVEGLAKVTTDELKPLELKLRNPGQIPDLAEDMSKNGFNPAKPIEYIEHQGGKYIVDGLHRWTAASQIGIDVFAQPASAQTLGDLAQRGFTYDYLIQIIEKLYR